MKIKIQVTKQNIKNGIRNKTISCPIALAVKACLPCDFVSVGPTWVTLPGPASCSSLSLPRSAQRFISRFDAGKKVKPFNFILDI